VNGKAPLFHESVRNIRRDWHAPCLVLERLDHKDDPQQETDQPNNYDEQTKKAPADETRDAMHHAQENYDERKPAEDDDGLRRMKFYPGTLIDKQKDDSRHPSEGIAQQSSDVFLQASAGCRRWWDRGSGGSGLASSTFRAEVRVPDVLATRFAECHEGIPPRMTFGGG
jgi:hypothetical protein